MTDRRLMSYCKSSKCRIWQRIRCPSLVPMRTLQWTIRIFPFASTRFVRKREICDTRNANSDKTRFVGLTPSFLYVERHAHFLFAQIFAFRFCLRCHDDCNRASVREWRPRRGMWCWPLMWGAVVFGALPMR